MFSAENLFGIGFILILTGFFIIFLTVLLSSFSSQKNGVKGGGVIFIGPIPIVFGSDAKTVKTLVYLMLILMVVIFFLLFTPILTFWR